MMGTWKTEATSWAIYLPLMLFGLNGVSLPEESASWLALMPLGGLAFVGINRLVELYFDMKGWQ